MFSIARSRLIASKHIRTSISRSLSAATGTEYLVVNAVTPDRPGIVSDITKIVVDQGGNVGGSSASRLGSHFGLMMLIAVPKIQREALQSALMSLPDMSTSCYLTDNPDAVDVTPEIGYAGEFSLKGADNPGIVHKVTTILSKYRLNIMEMKTYEDKSAPYGGVSLFYMSGLATSPAPLAKGFDPRVVREELEDLGNKMNCDITLEDVVDDDDSASFYVS